MCVLQDSYHSIRVILADSGYCGTIIKEVKEKFGYWLQIVLRKESNSSNFKTVYKKWVVERTFAWFDNDQQLCRNYGLPIETAEEMDKLSAIKAFRFANIMDNCDFYT
ncbi:MAG: hypothetical protein QM629_13240 [Parafilimonas sp.]